LVSQYPAVPLSDYKPLIINAAITGMVPQRSDSKHVPISISEIVQDACLCIEAGASIVHLHARNPDGSPSYSAAIYADILTGIRAIHPKALLCVSTSGRSFPEFEQRSEVLYLEGAAKPDMASLTLGSLNFANQASVNSPEMIVKLATTMKERGILPELEVFDSGMISMLHYLQKKQLLNSPSYCNILLGSMFTGAATLSEAAHIIRELPDGVHWALAGIGRYQLKMNTLAIIEGGHVRVGLEDNLYFGIDKSKPATNVELIKRLVVIADVFERKIATPEDVRSMLGRA
jgi:3-keto-5-aminohexanoate cleavage enzyme